MSKLAKKATNPFRNFFQNPGDLTHPSSIGSDPDRKQKQRNRRSLAYGNILDPSFRPLGPGKTVTAAGDVLGG